MPSEETQVIQNTQHWLENMVLGLNLCPFAHSVHKENRIDYIVSSSRFEEQLLEHLQASMQELIDTPSDVIDTALFIMPNAFEDFLDYNDALDWVDQIIEHNQWQGILQIASFHPRYQFEDTEIDDQENYTNRAPYPIFHILREESLENALANYPEPENIPSKNIQQLNTMDKAQLKALIQYSHTTWHSNRP